MIKLFKLVIICILFWNIPFLIKRLYSFYKTKQSLPRLVGKSRIALEQLPTEILLKILEKSSIVEIYRLSSCSKYLCEIVKDPLFWEKKFYLDFFSKPKTHLKSLNYKFLYKQRYLLLESNQERDYRRGVNGIINDEFNLGFYRTWHLLLLPCKICGFLGFRVYELLYTFKPILTPNSTCLDLLRLDILEYSRKFNSWRNYEILFLGIILSLVLILYAFLVKIFLFFLSTLKILKIPATFYVTGIFISEMYLVQSLTSLALTIPILVSLNETLQRETRLKVFRGFSVILEVIFSVEIYAIFSVLKILHELGEPIK